MDDVKVKKINRSLILNLMPGFVLLAAMIVIIFYKDKLFMKARYDLHTASGFSFGEDGNMVLIDEGRSSIKILDKKMRMIREYKGESENSFYYADHALLKDGVLYVADTRYDEKDKNIETKRLLTLNGNKVDVLFEKRNDLSDIDNRNEILDIQVKDGDIFFLISVDYGLESYVIKKDLPWPELISRYYTGDRINDAAYDLESGTVAIAVKRGYIRIYDPEKGKWDRLETFKDHIMPNRIALRNNNLYFSELYENKVFSVDLSAKDTINEVIKVEGKPLYLETDTNGERLAAGSTDGFYLYTDGTKNFFSSIRYAGYYKTLMLWGIIILAAFCFVFYLRVVLKNTKRVFSNENAIRIVIVVFAVYAVAFFVAYSLMSELFSREEETLVDNMKLYADLLAGQTDAELIGDDLDEHFYGTSAYKALRMPLDEMTKKAHAEGKNYEYALFAVSGDEIFYVLNSNDDVMCKEAPEEGLSARFLSAGKSGNTYAISRKTSLGSYISIIEPVYTNGKIKAMLEVSLDMSLRNKEKRASVFNTVFNVFCTTAVVMMLILEGVFLLSFLEKRQKLSEKELGDVTNITPLRTLIFFTNAADSIQDAFVALLCEKVYMGGLPVPNSVAIALPLSAQLLMLALFSSFMGTVGEKHGPSRVMGIGLLVQGAGCITCMLTGNYLGILIGKMMIGAGMGTVYVNCYAVAAKGKTEESSAAAFTEISAGSLSGVTIGAGLSSVFLSIGGWRLVYAVGAILLFVAFLVAYSVREKNVAKDVAVKEQVKEREKSGIKEFIGSAPVTCYFFLILLPFMMSLAYREYYLPLKAGEYNVSEVNISRFYLLCGLVFLYLGPALTRFVIKHLGLFRGICLATFLMAEALLLNVIRPTVVMAFFGMVLLSLVTSFSYGCMYTFFGSLPASVKFGEARSMEVYTVFESIGSTAGPVVYGFLLSLGPALGLSIFGIGMIAFTGGYSLILRLNKKREKT
ncbi:MAG: MFS transporter [Lachnospiraceae bacterium]|nr:MFS transporter [Lachnospiraceae bacterium]